MPRAPVPWYVMTSHANDVDTRAFFRRHNFFGLNPKDVFFFVQRMLPAISFDGKLLLAAKDKLAMSPHRHGGSLCPARAGCWTTWPAAGWN